MMNEVRCSNNWHFLLLSLMLLHQLALTYMWTMDALMNLRQCFSRKPFSAIINGRYCSYTVQPEIRSANYPKSSCWDFSSSEERVFSPFRFSDRKMLIPNHFNSTRSHSRLLKHMPPTLKTRHSRTAMELLPHQHRLFCSEWQPDEKTKSSQVLWE